MAAAVLAKFGKLERIPSDWREWRVNVAQASALSATLLRDYDSALLFRTLAQLRTEVPLFEDVDTLRWRGPTDAFPEFAARFDSAVTSRKRR